MVFTFTYEFQIILESYRKPEKSVNYYNHSVKY